MQTELKDMSESDQPQSKLRDQHVTSTPQSAWPFPTSQNAKHRVAGAKDATAFPNQAKKGATLENGITPALRNIIRSSESWVQARERVIRSYGNGGYLYDAEGIALEEKGREWVDGRVTTAAGGNLPISQTQVPELERRCIAATFIAILVIVAFPPYYLPLTDGLRTNLGFSFLFAPPKVGQLFGLIYVPLLLAEVVIAVLLGGISVYAVRRFLTPGHRTDIENEFALAETFGPLASTWLLPLAAAHLDGPKWAAKEPHYMAGYLQGFGDVVAQSMGHETGSMLGANIALQFAKTLFDGASATSFIEFSMSAEGPSLRAGLADGGLDGNGFVSKKAPLPLALAKHLGV